MNKPLDYAALAALDSAAPQAHEAYARDACVFAVQADLIQVENSLRGAPLDQLLHARRLIQEATKALNEGLSARPLDDRRSWISVKTVDKNPVMVVDNIRTGPTVLARTRDQALAVAENIRQMANLLPP